VGEQGGVALDEKLNGATTMSHCSGKGRPGLVGGLGKKCEAIDGAGPEAGSEKEIAGLGGRSDLIGEPVK
jgi:hypothetical protein